MPITYSPGYSIHNRLPYAEHFNFSIQRETIPIDGADAGIRRNQGHQLISQYDADPGTPSLCMQLNR